MPAILEVKSSRVDFDKPLPREADDLTNRLTKIINLYNTQAIAAKIGKDKVDSITRLGDSLGSVIAKMGVKGSNQGYRRIVHDLFSMFEKMAAAIEQGETAIKYDQRAGFTINNAFQVLEDIVPVITLNFNPDVVNSYRRGALVRSV